MFYDRYVSLCFMHGVSPSRAALEAGLSKSTVTKWKTDPNAVPTGNVIGKLTRYFGVTVAQLLGEDEMPAPVRQTLPDDGSFYQTFRRLSHEKGVSPSRAALDAGLSKSTVTKWKTDPNARPNGSVLARLSEYFGVPISELMGEAPEQPAAPDDAIKFALFGGSEDITDEMFEEVRAFAAFVKMREENKRKKSD